VKKWNIFLTIAIAGILLLPGAAIGSIVSACCGVDVADLVVNVPSESCCDDELTISGTFNVFSDWGDWTEEWSAGVNIKIYDSGAVKVAEFNPTLASGVNADPGMYPGTSVPFSQGWTPDEPDTYTVEVVAWGSTYYGTMTTNAVANAVVVEQCSEVDIKPGSCPNAFNPFKKGVLPVGITGGEGFDATLVDSVTVNGVAMSKFEIMDTAMPGMSEGPGCFDCESYELTPIYDAAGAIIGYEADGIDDFIAYFSAADVAAALGTVAKGDCVTVTVEYTYDGNEVEQTGTLWIVK
jgi:hypothetical protein